MKSSGYVKRLFILKTLGEMRRKISDKTLICFLGIRAKGLRKLPRDATKNTLKHYLAN